MYSGNVFQICRVAINKLIITDGNQKHDLNFFPNEEYFCIMTSIS